MLLYLLPTFVCALFFLDGAIFFPQFLLDIIFTIKLLATRVLVLVELHF